MKGFDRDFWLGVGLVMLLIGVEIAIATIFKIDFVFLFISSGVLIWALLHLWVKRLLRTSPKEITLVYCEWQGRINELDFDANQKSTISSLEEIGFTLEQTIGMTFLFHSEPSLTDPDIYFQGVFVRNSYNKIVIRASNPLPI